MKKLFVIFCLLYSILFLGCGNEEIGQQSFSKGTQTSQEHLEEMRNIDKRSYAEVADVFLDNNLLASNDKPIMIVFGANGCVYCDKLKEVVKNNSDVKLLLQEEFSPYYINGSYTKNHTISQEITAFESQKNALSTQELIQKFNVGPTPTLVFLDDKGKFLFSYQGFLPKERFMVLLDFFTQKNSQNFTNKTPKEIAQDLQKTYDSKGV